MVSGMAQEERMLANKPDNQSSEPTWWEEELTPEGHLLNLLYYAMAYAHIHTK